MPDDRAKLLDTVRKIVALSLYNPENADAHNANDKARDLLRKHEITLEELLGGKAAAEAWGPAEVMRFVGRIQDGGADLFLRAQAFMSHPDTQKGIDVVKNLIDLGGKGVAALKKRKRVAGSRR